MSKVLPFPAMHIPTTRAEAAAGFYSVSEAARLARVPRQRLYAWQREGIVFPTVYATDVDDREVGGYTFETLVYLRLLRMLRDQEIALSKAVATVQHLRERFGPPGAGWELARILVHGKDVFVDGKDDWEITVSTRGGQKAATELFGEEFAEFRERADALLVPRHFRSAVEIDPRIRSGHPVVRGTTLATEVLSAIRRRGESYRAIQAAYPHVTLPQIKRAIAFERFLDAEAT